MVSVFDQSQTARYSENQCFLHVKFCDFVHMTVWISAYE